MIRKFKMFGVMAVMALALTAVAASAAQATGPLFHVESIPATITGSQTTTQVFATESGSVECANATFHGTQSTSVTTSSQTLEAAYSGCKFGGFNAEVKMNGCDYVFNLVTGSSPATATADVVCPAGQSIEIIAAGFCVTTVPAQKGLSHITFENTGSKTTRDIDANVTISGITYTACFFCPGAGTFNTGTLTGGATVKADAGAKQQGLWVA